MKRFENLVNYAEPKLFATGCQLQAYHWPAELSGGRSCLSTESTISQAVAMIADRTASQQTI